MDTKMDANQTCTEIVGILTRHGWEDAKIGHYRNADVPNLAIEVGYVYGETTVRLNQLDGAVDKGTYKTLRGIGSKFIDEIRTLVSQVTSAGVSATWPEGRG